MIRKNTYGAEWGKWDLHFHTPSSYDYQNKSITNEDIIKKLSEENISVVAITDHHIIDVERIKELQNLAKGKNIMILPGIEFLSDYRAREPIHFIGIFKEDADISFIWSQLEAKTNISRIRGEGMQINEVYCSFPDTIKLIHELGGLVSVHAGHKSNSFEGIPNTLPQSDAMKLDIAKLVDIFEIGKIEDVSGYNTSVVPFIYKKIQKKHPVIICSDNHNINDYQTRSICWIKAEPSFEGLKQIIYEPEARVKIQDVKPEEKPSYQLINSITFNHKDFSKEPIYFNPNLNTIIGGRSSGKSILLGCIAKKTDSAVLVKERINGELSSHDKYINEICKNVKIEWNDKQPDNEHKIEYYAQSEINNYASDSKKIDSIVQRIINKDDEKRNALDRYSIFQINNQKDITNKIAELIDLREKKLAVDEQIKGIGNKQGLEDEISKLKKDVSEMKKSREGSISEEELNKFGESVEQMHLLENKFDSWGKDINSLSLLKEKELIMPISGEISKLSEDVKNRVFKIYEDINTNVKKIWFESIENLEKDLSETTNDCKTKISEITASSLYARGLEYLKENETYANKTQLIKDEENKLRQIMSLEKEKENLHKNYVALFDNIILLNNKYYDETKKLADFIKQKEGGVEISAKSDFATDRIISTLEKCINKTYGEGKKLKDFKGKKQDDFITFFRSLFLNIDNGTVKLTKDTSLQSLLTSLLAINYYSITYKVKYEGDDLEAMSEGKKAFIILRLLLDFDDSVWPILIDQPEDDLDNRAIYTDLVTYLRDKKTKRQIILVTHNPNIVVGADSELVIVANKHGSKNENPDKIKFCYYGDTLESSFIDNEERTVLYKQGIKEHICEILEGGDAAFKLREKKYGYDK